VKDLLTKKSLKDKMAENGKIIMETGKKFFNLFKSPFTKEHNQASE
jgi:hypothetical protein